METHRRRRPQAEKRELVRRQPVSRLSVTDFCRREGVAASCFYRWRQEIDDAPTARDLTTTLSADSIICQEVRGNMIVAQLVVRRVDEALVDRLRERAAANQRSVEEEHRQILERALLGPRRRSFSEVLESMPNVGEDADFVRVQDI